MALNIPNIGTNADALMKGVNTGSNMFANLMHPILERERQKQLEEHFKQELALRKAAAARAGANSDLSRQIMQQQLLGLQHKNDPMYDFNQFKALQDMVMGGGQAPNQGGQSMPQEQMPTQEMGQGMGMYSPGGMDEAQAAIPQMPQGSQGMGGGGNNPMADSLRQNPLLRGFFKHKFGFDPLAVAPESPEQKRALDLQSKVDLENIKTENKNKALQNKELIAVNKDLPTLEKSLKSVDELLSIAKRNPDMFGHNFMPERYSKTTKIKDFGKWQNLLSDAIVGLEQKLSSKGNIVALKMASQLKPSHAEQQPVAIGKLESMRQQLSDAIGHSRELLGKNGASQYRDNDLVVVEGPNGEETMTYAQAKKLGAK